MCILPEELDKVLDESSKNIKEKCGYTGHMLRCL